MEIFSALLAICAGNSPVLGEFPTQRPVTRGFDVSFDCVWINGWVNNGEAGDLKHYRTHYDVSVMNPLARFYGRPLLCPGQPSFFTGCADFCNSSKCIRCSICGDGIQLWVVAVCQLPSQTKAAIIPTNSLPVTAEIIVWSVQCAVLRWGGVGWGVLWGGWRWSIVYPLLLRIMRGKCVPLSVQDQIGAHQSNWRSCLCPYGSKAFNNSWISLRTSRQLTQTDAW